MGSMRDKKIILGVTGGIAAYKAAELTRILRKMGARVQVAMTANATRFVTPLTFEALTGNRVLWKMYDRGTRPMDHITMGQESDLIIVAPATANFLGKMANGFADDFLTTMITAATAKVLVCPSMNSRMFSNPVVQENMKRIIGMGHRVMPTGEGELACNTEGPGRLPEPDEIAEQAQEMLSVPDLPGWRILVTAGPTVEPLDPVRFLSNRSTGKMGYALASAAAQRGASVSLVSGPTHLRPHRAVRLIAVRTAEEMRQAVFDNRKDADIIIKAAAVSDYRPRKILSQKMKKAGDSMSLDLVKNPDILAELGKDKEDFHYILVGFAAETEDMVENAREKLEKKNLDIIVVNDVSRRDAGFESDTNLVSIIFRDGPREDLPLMTKGDVANQLLDRIKKIKKTSLC